MIMDPACSCEIPSCSAFDLAKTWPVITGVVTVLGCPGQGASQITMFKLGHPVLMVAYDVACFPNVSIRMAWISFGALPCRKKKIDERLCFDVEIVCHLTCFLLASVTRKDSQFGKWTDPSFHQHYWFCPMTLGCRSG
jgi:hypothetical protein